MGTNKADSSEVLRPGMKAPVSRQYALYGPRGAPRGTGITAIEGNRLPPTPNPGERYRLADPTTHKRPK